jgi:hypothetical protein
MILHNQSIPDCVNTSNGNFMENSATLIKRASINANLLDSIKVGDLLSDEYGKSGKVCEIEKINRHGEFHYYFKLLKSGTILIIL